MTEQPEDLDERTLSELSKFMNKNGMKIMDASHDAVQSLQKYKDKLEVIHMKFSEILEGQVEAIVSTQIKLTRLAEEMILANNGYDDVIDDDIDDTYNAPDEDDCSDE